MTRAKASDLSERELLESHAKALEAQVEGLRQECERLTAECAAHALDAQGMDNANKLLRADAERYQFLRRGEDQLGTAREEKVFADMWAAIYYDKACCRGRMDKVVDQAMRDMQGEPTHGDG